MKNPRDHGGGVDAAVARWGGARADWLDLSTGINPVPYPLPDFTAQDWGALPDAGAQAALVEAARAFWNVPKGAGVLAAPGASALIARLPALWPSARVDIATPTYNEHAAGFRAEGWEVMAEGAVARVRVQPNNPDGRVWGVNDFTGVSVRIIDESFCDVMPEASLIDMAVEPDTLVLKSFGKFWGLAGVRLGFAIGQPALLTRLAEMLGPWPVTGPALRVGTAALRDVAWADATRDRLAADAARLDAVVGAPVVGGTTLFRLYDVGDAAAFQDRLARARVWSRIFPYSDHWVRLGLPGSPADWAQLEAALA